MIQRQCFVLLLCSMAISCGLLWNALLVPTLADNRRTKDNLEYSNVTRGIASLVTKQHPINESHQLHPINYITTAKLREKVEKLMKPWQTIQIFPPHLDPREMRFPFKLVDIKKQKNSRKTHGIKDRVKSCAVVGNSGILLGSNCGRVIDKMDVIIRMNLAEFGHEYSSDVGSKVTFMTINTEQLRELFACSREITIHGKEASLRNGTIIPSPCKKLVKRLMMLGDGVLWLFKGTIPGIRNALHSLMTRFSIKLQFAYSPLSSIRPSRSLWNFHFPSTGLAMYTASTQLCDEISLFGFYPFYTDECNRTILHHYYEPELKINYTQNPHTIPKEHKFFVTLEEIGAIRLINNCTQFYHTEAYVPNNSS